MARIPTAGAAMDDAKTRSAIEALNHIMEIELSGVVKYTHYSLMVYGYNRIPVVSCGNTAAAPSASGSTMPTSPFIKPMS